MQFEVYGEPVIGPEYLVPTYPIDNYIIPESLPNSGILNYNIDSLRILLADFS